MPDHRNEGPRPEARDHAAYPRRSANGWLITAGVLAGLATLLVLRAAFSPELPRTSPAPFPAAQRPGDSELRDLQFKAERQQRWVSKVQPRLAVADEACAESIDKAIRVVSNFVADRKQGARPFAEAMLGFRSKWNLVISKLPSWLGGDANAHRSLLEARFSEHIFTSEQMKQAVEAAVKTYLNHVEDIENQLLVAVRADLEGLPAEVIPGIGSRRFLGERFSKMVAAITPEVAKDLGLNVGKFGLEWVASELAIRIAVRVLSSVATRLGVSAGILGAGATASWATVGLSFLASIVVDQVVGWIINWDTDPVGNLEARVQEMLDEGVALIVEGDGETEGLQAALTQLNGARSRLRAEALRRIVVGE